MQNGEGWLRWGALGTGTASLLHLAIIFGGPDWYRFFGAGERMAQLSARGAIYPTLITLSIALVLGLWTLYALSGARIIRRLPFLRLALVLIASVYFARAVLGIPVVLFVKGPYIDELRGRMTFMVVSSLISLSLGFCYAFGAAWVWQRSRRTSV